MDTREKVAELLDRGWSYNAIAAELGIVKSTVAYHARAYGKPIDDRCNRRYDWAAIQRYYDEGHSVTECQEHFGFARASWHSAVKRGELKARPHGMPLEQLLARRRNRNHLKARLFGLGLKENRCEACGITAWRELPLNMALHHINGVPHDNRLENLQLLCPNCHSQTENFAGRNRRLNNVVRLDEQDTGRS